MFGSDLHDKNLTASLDITVYFGIGDIDPKEGFCLTWGIRDHFAVFPWHKDLFGFSHRLAYLISKFRYDDVDENF
jgi:hypothetical protein